MLRTGVTLALTLEVSAFQSFGMSCLLLCSYHSLLSITNIMVGCIRLFGSLVLSTSLVTLGVISKQRK
jgi:hypothetical protein